PARSCPDTTTPSRYSSATIGCPGHRLRSLPAWPVWTTASCYRLRRASSAPIAGMASPPWTRRASNGYEDKPFIRLRSRTAIQHRHRYSGYAHQLSCLVHDLDRPYLRGTTHVHGARGAGDVTASYGPDVVGVDVQADTYVLLGVDTQLRSAAAERFRQH